MEHQKQWEFLKNKFEANQLSHSYIFSGPKEADILAFAKEFVKSLNCLKPNIKQKTCRECQNCILIERGSFPDLLAVKSENSESSIENKKDMMEIDIGQIRQVNNFLSYKSYYGGWKSVIIENAERMNAQAQQSFLKTLEEPKGKTLIILASSKSETL